MRLYTLALLPEEPPGAAPGPYGDSVSLAERAGGEEGDGAPAEEILLRVGHHEPLRLEPVLMRARGSHDRAWEEDAALDADPVWEGDAGVPGEHGAEPALAAWEDEGEGAGTGAPSFPGEDADPAGTAPGEDGTTQEPGATDARDPEVGIGAAVAHAEGGPDMAGRRGGAPRGETGWQERLLEVATGGGEGMAAELYFQVRCFETSGSG